MSGIARVMLSRGMTVSGSDSAPSALLDELVALGANVYVGHAAMNLGNLGPGDTLVVSSAIRQDNPELTEAQRRGVRVLHRAAALASVMAGRRVIAVAGTHGKTTTTSMLTTVLRDCGAEPGYVIGGILRETGLNAEDGAGLDFVAEADESDRSFLLLSPNAAVITNVEADHLDNYPDLAAIEDAFTAFGQRVSGLVMTCADDPGAERVAARLDPARVRRYGESPSADYRLADVHPDGMKISLTVTAEHSPFGEIYSHVTLGVPGRHNALNATAAFAMAVELGFAPPRVTAALAGYRGARRRMELKGEAGRVRVLDSYGHHPTEVAADLRAAVAGCAEYDKSDGQCDDSAAEQPHRLPAREPRRDQVADETNRELRCGVALGQGQHGRRGERDHGQHGARPEPAYGRRKHRQHNEDQRYRARHHCQFC